MQCNDPIRRIGVGLFGGSTVAPHLTDLSCKVGTPSHNPPKANFSRKQKKSMERCRSAPVFTSDRPSTSSTGSLPTLGPISRRPVTPSTPVPSTQEPTTPPASAKKSRHRFAGLDRRRAEKMLRVTKSEATLDVVLVNKEKDDVDDRRRWHIGTSLVSVTNECQKSPSEPLKPMEFSATAKNAPYVVGLEEGLFPEKRSYSSRDVARIPGDPSGVLLLAVLIHDRQSREGRIPADFSRGCKEVYLDTDGFVKTRDRKCSFSSGELAKLGVVCQSGIPLSCPDSIPYAGLEVKEAARNIPSGTAVAGNTITFKCDRCVKTFKNFPDENEIVSKCYANAGWFPYKSLIGDCKLPCNGTIPVVKNSDENCASTTTGTTGSTTGGTTGSTTTGTTGSTTTGTTGSTTTGTSGSTTVTSTCLASSQTWTIPPQTCEPACSANLTVVNDTRTDFSGERFINSTVTYICKPGYTYNESDPLDTKRSIMCQSDKTWQTWDKKNKCVPQPPIRLTSGSNNG
ncbi:unnamed protein product, partial [Notodromas monacha]